MIKGDDVYKIKQILEFSDLKNVKCIEYDNENFVVTSVKVSEGEYHEEKVIIPCNEMNWKTFKKYYFNK